MWLLLAFIVEIIHRVIGKLWNFQPLLTRAEVYNNFFQPAMVVLYNSLLNTDV